jgi:hypothetical protein
MLWSPVVRRSSGKPEYDQFAHLQRVEEVVASKTGVKITLVVNRAYVNAIKALRAFARGETRELKSPVMRFLQIEEWSQKNVNRIELSDAPEAEITVLGKSTSPAPPR